MNSAERGTDDWSPAPEARRHQLLVRQHAPADAAAPLPEPDGGAAQAAGRADPVLPAGAARAERRAQEPWPEMKTVQKDMRLHDYMRWAALPLRGKMFSTLGDTKFTLPNPFVWKSDPVILVYY